MTTDVNTPKTKVCRVCKKRKPITDFYTCKKTVNKSGRLNHCYICQSNYARDWQRRNKDKVAANQKRYRNKHRTRVTKSRRARQYGMTVEELEQLFAIAKLKCMICDATLTEREAQVDHCHDSGKVRGLLCPTCNRGLGQFHNDTQKLQAAIDYLNKPKEIQTTYKRKIRRGRPRLT